MADSKTIHRNVKKSHVASSSSRIKEEGLSPRKAKLSPKNFDRLMEERGLPEADRKALSTSMDKKTMTVRHAKAGEEFVTTHGTENSSGIFVSKKSLGATSSERIDKGALPHSNTADYETKVILAKDQNLVSGTIAPQSKFSKMDPKQQPRTGGGQQTITDGGYKSGAVINWDSKYPTKANDAFIQRANQYKNSQNAPKQTNSSEKSLGKNKGQTR